MNNQRKLIGFQVIFNHKLICSKTICKAKLPIFRHLGLLPFWLIVASTLRDFVSIPKTASAITCAGKINRKSGRTSKIKFELKTLVITYTPEISNGGFAKYVDSNRIQYISSVKKVRLPNLPKKQMLMQPN